MKIDTSFVSDYANLRTFTDVAAWDAKADAAIEGFKKEASFINQSLAKLQAMEPSKEVKRLIEEANTLLGRIVNSIDTLEDQQALTPNNAEEKQMFLDELKVAKRELQLELRSTNAEMKAMRANARTQNAQVDNQLFSTATSRRYNRLSIRLQKEAQLKPSENRRTALERQILQIDKRIVWLKRITA